MFIKTLPAIILVLLSSLSFAQDRYIPNDPLFSHQWWADNIGQTYIKPYAATEDTIFLKEEVGTPDIDIDLPEAWAIEQGSDDCLIAVLDGGFQLDQPDLEGQFSENGWNFIRGDSIVTSGNSHGTSVSGIIAGKINNNTGIAGVAPGCKILPIVVTPGKGLAFNLPKDKSPAAEAIRYAIKNNATVISMSFVLPSVEKVIEVIKTNYLGDKDVPPEQLSKIVSTLTEQTNVIKTELKAAIDEAYAANIPIIAGAGNKPVENKNYPAAFEKVISVTAVNSRGNLAAFANRGAWVTLSAPGEFIVTCTNTWAEKLPMPCSVGDVCYNHGDYCHPDGTSFATPMVAGVVGLLKSKYPDMTVDEVRETLLKTAKPNKSNPSAPPIVSAGNALKNPVFK